MTFFLKSFKRSRFRYGVKLECSTNAARASIRLSSLLSIGKIEKKISGFSELGVVKKWPDDDSSMGLSLKKPKFHIFISPD